MSIEPIEHVSESIIEAVNTMATTDKLKSITDEEM